jgi:uncharacterized membrane protein
MTVVVRTVAAATASLGYVAVSQWLMTSAPTSAWNAVAVLAPMLIAIAVCCWRAGHLMWSAAVIAGLSALVVAAARGGDVAPSLLYLAQHAGVHLFLAGVFGATLRRGAEPLITRVAERVHRELTPAMRIYTRQVTLAWTCYFVAMTAVSVALHAWAPFGVWAWFANLLTPLALCAMFGGEHLLRYRLHPGFERASVAAAWRAYRSHGTRVAAASSAAEGPYA